MPKKTIPHGEKTVKVIIHFFTPDEEDNKKLIWHNGFVRVASNRSRGLRGEKQVFFHNLDELEDKVKQALRAAGIIVVKKTKENKKEIIEY